jgi:hypothetical protein
VCVEEVPNYDRVLIYRDATQAIAGSTNVKILYTQAEYDTASAFSAANNDIVIPAGKSMARFSFGIDTDAAASSIFSAVYKVSDGLRKPGLPHDGTRGTYLALSGLGMWTPVTPGDHYAHWVHGAAHTLPVSDATWLAAEFR